MTADLGEIDVLIEEDRWGAVDLESLAVAAWQALGAHLDLPGGHEVVLMGCDDARIAALNGSFRHKSRPTNVLSWPEAERGAATPGGSPLPIRAGEALGDIAIAFETCAREAAEQGKPLKDHATHLILHGLLHLLGYDHETDADAALMEGLEVEILGKLGFDDPYS